MTSPTVAEIGFPRALSLAQRDLKAIADRLPTMHDEGWCPPAPDYDRPTPHRPPGSDPDQVPGLIHDCGLGDEKVRVGWMRMVHHLHRAETASAEVLAALLGLRCPCVPRCRPTSLLDAQSSVRRLQERLKAAQAIHSTLVAQQPPRAMWLGRQLMGERGRPQWSCLWHIEQAMYETQRVVAEVGSGKPPPMCPKCRRVGSIGQPRKGGLCFACDKRQYRLERRSRQVKVRRARNASSA